MKCLVMGAGAVGGYFGGFLARAGLDVTFVARGDHADALRQSGLCLLGPRGDIRLGDLAVVDSPAGVHADIVFLCTKTYNTEQAIETLRACLTPDTLLITLQNGVDSFERIRGLGVSGPIISGLAFVSAVIERPGCVRYTSDMSSLTLGRFPRAYSDMEKSLGDAFERVGVGFKIADDIKRELWRKFLLLSTNAALTSLSRAPAGVVFHDPDLVRIARSAIAEVYDVCCALGVDLEPAAMADAMIQARSFPADMFASMYHDLVTGRPLELEELTGTLVALARMHDVSVPIHETAYACLKPYARGDFHAFAEGLAHA